MKRIIAIMLCFTAALSFTGCGKKNMTEDATENMLSTIEKTAEELTGKSVINLQMRTIDLLDPILTKKQSVRDGLMVVYEPLFDITDKFALKNVLAEKYAFNDNATIMTLKIKEGVLWHSGHSFVADDVVYTVNKIKENPDSSYYLNLESVDRVEKQNDYEVVFYLNRSNAQLPYSLYFPIMYRNDVTNESLIGTGPFMFEKADGESLTLTKNMFWHGGEVKADGVKFIYLRTAAMAQEAFSSGKIHAVTKDMLDIENFAIKENQTKHVYPDGIFEFMGFNANSGIFTNPLIRIAAANAIDRREISPVFDGAIESGFPIMAGSEGFTPSYETTAYNLDYAKELIFTAGWSDVDADGKCEQVVGGEVKKLEFTLLVADREESRGQAAEIIKTQLELAGFIVNVEVVDLETYNTRVAWGEYDAFLGAVYYDAPYDVSALLQTGGEVNYQGYSSVEMDQAIYNFAVAADMEKAPQAFSALQAVYMAHQPITGLAFRTTYIVTSPVIKGEVMPYPYSPYANIASWAIE